MVSTITLWFYSICMTHIILALPQPNITWNGTVDEHHKLTEKQTLDAEILIAENLGKVRHIDIESNDIVPQIINLLRTGSEDNRLQIIIIGAPMLRQFYHETIVDQEFKKIKQSILRKPNKRAVKKACKTACSNALDRLSKKEHLELDAELKIVNYCNKKCNHLLNSEDYTLESDSNTESESRSSESDTDDYDDSSSSSADEKLKDLSISIEYGEV